MSVNRFLCWLGALPVGVTIAGVVGEVWGVRAAIAASGVLVVVVGAAAGLPLPRVSAQDYDPVAPGS